MGAAAVLATTHAECPLLRDEKRWQGLSCPTLGFEPALSRGCILCGSGIPLGPNLTVSQALAGAGCHVFIADSIQSTMGRDKVFGPLRGSWYSNEWSNEV